MPRAFGKKNDTVVDQTTDGVRIIGGTEGDDRLRGGKGNDTFEGSAGDDRIIGNDGVDTVIYSGSVFDYTWDFTGRYWSVYDWNGNDGDTGRDTLQDVEILQFDDATIVLGQDSPTIITGPQVVDLVVGEDVTVTYNFVDYDNRLDISSGQTSLPAAGYFRFQGDSASTGGLQNSNTILHLTYTTSGRWFSPTLHALALGETLTVTYTWVVDPMPFQFGNDPDPIRYDIDFVISGVNDAPTIAGGGLLEVVEDSGIDAVFDLSVLGDDIDSDDDGATLTYEILSLPEGLDVSVVGTDLILSVANVDQRLTSDETIAGEVVLRAVDRHGAASVDTVVIDLRARGTDDPLTVYVTPTGVDFGLLGIDPSSEPDLGLLQVFGDSSELLPLLQFTEGDDVRIINATSMFNFDSIFSIRDADGNELLESAAFDTRGGDDILAIGIEGAGNVGFGSSEIDTGMGEDIVSIDMRSTTVGTSTGGAILNGVDIDTGMNSDQVWISASADTNAWIAGNFRTGSGHDILEMRIDDPDQATAGGHAFFNGSVNLGSGDDSFRLIIDTGTRALNAEIDISLSAGDGDDFVHLSNRGTDLVLVPGTPTGEPWDQLFRAGLTGSVDMGAGDDEVILDLNDAYVSGAQASIKGGNGHDILRILGETTETIVCEVGTADGMMTVVDGYQRLAFLSFEEVWIGDELLYG